MYYSTSSGAVISVIKTDASELVLAQSVTGGRSVTFTSSDVLSGFSWRLAGFCCLVIFVIIKKMQISENMLTKEAYLLGTGCPFRLALMSIHPNHITPDIFEEILKMCIRIRNSLGSQPYFASLELFYVLGTCIPAVTESHFGSVKIITSRLQEINKKITT